MVLRLTGGNLSERVLQLHSGPLQRHDEFIGNLSDVVNDAFDVDNRVVDVLGYQALVDAEATRLLETEGVACPD